MNRGFFITGTDTEVGKTWCSLGLIDRLQQQGHTVAAMKPVASGCAPTAAGLRNDDALKLQAQASVALAYETINPYAFEPAIAPHIAAELAGQRIELSTIVTSYRRLAAEAEISVVEGVGGWRVPLNDAQTVADLAGAIGLPVILVVGLRLGCINHALLTAESIRASGCTLAGWIANSVEPRMAQQEDNVHAIAERIGAPLLGLVPHLPQGDAGAIAACLSLPR
ncbi:MAG: dethiobiotin synthase [Gammaproteobacteria bacterium]|nr:dethiobiotin synthase [Gammaproteobacteria bacterium]